MTAMRSHMRFALCCASLALPGLAVAADRVLRAEEDGRLLAAEVRAMRPVESFTNQATLRIRDAGGGTRRLPLTIINRIGPEASWEVVYAAGGPQPQTLTVIRTPDRPPEYRMTVGDDPATTEPVSAEAVQPFAGSDFSLRELGLEFLHWPGQRLLPRNPPPMKKGQPCKILESTDPSAPGYTRVLSWVSIEHNGLMLADAYDASGKIVKRFSIGSLKKVDGVWQLRDMEMIDEVRGTATKLEFELKARE